MNIPKLRLGDRWGVLSGLDVGADGDPYLDRLRLVQTPLFAVFLHHIHRADLDRDPHDHPWSFVSVVLAGGYEELVRRDKRNSRAQMIRQRPRFSCRCLSRRGAHIITRIQGPLWTLVVTGPSRGTDSWGFWRDGEFIPWRQYGSANGAEEYARDKEAEDKGRAPGLAGVPGSAGHGHRDREAAG